VGSLAHKRVLDGRWAAALASSGLLASGLDAVASLLSSSGDEGSNELVSRCWQLVAVGRNGLLLSVACCSAGPALLPLICSYWYMQHTHKQLQRLRSCFSVPLILLCPAMQMGWEVNQVVQTRAALDSAAMAAVADGAASGLPDSLAAQLGTAIDSLRQQRQAWLARFSVVASSAEVAAQLRQLLQPAAELAALLQQYYALPAVDKPHRLALAKAAAGRSCAYLRCANVEGQGGTGARQGVGSKCCRWVGGCVVGMGLGPRK